MKASNNTNVLQKKSFSSVLVAFYWSLGHSLYDKWRDRVPVAVPAYCCYCFIVIVFIVVNVLEIDLFERQKLRDFFLTRI